MREMFRGALFMIHTLVRVLHVSPLSVQFAWNASFHTRPSLGNSCTNALFITPSFKESNKPYYCAWNAGFVLACKMSSDDSVQLFTWELQSHGFLDRKGQLSK